MPQQPLPNKPKKEPVLTSQDKRYVYGIVAVIAAAIILGFGAWIIHQTNQNDAQTLAASPTPTSSVSSSPTASPSASASASPTTSPSVSPSASVSASLPTSAQNFIAAFYAAYKAKQTATLASQFTPDTSAAMQSEHARMFTGKDTNGNPGGPTIFLTNSASESVSSYVLKNQVLQGSNWTLTISEQRLNAQGASDGTEVTVMTIVPNGNSWLIDSYYHQGEGIDKYGGFLIP